MGWRTVLRGMHFGYGAACNWHGRPVPRCRL